MTSQPKKRWPPRFGMKSLFAVVLVVAAYFGSWPWLEESAHKDVEATAAKRHEIEQENCAEHIFSRKVDRASMLYVAFDSHAPASAAPYIMSADEAEFDGYGHSGTHRRYYLWLFGWTVRLPFTSSQRDHVVEPEPIGTRLEHWGRRVVRFTQQPPVP